MRIFEKMNTSGKEVCPICKTQNQKPVILIVKAGTREGNIAEAIQVHVDCLELIYDKTHGLIYQKVEDDE
jgi:hypothetical protein